MQGATAELAEFLHEHAELEPLIDLVVIDEAHYMRNFMPTDVIMENVDAIRNIPTHIVQGRHDVCCPPMSAYDLSRELSRCTLEFTQAGHSGGMPENIRGLVAAANRILSSGLPLQ